MAYEILSIKLDELDRRFARLHRLIQIGESANRDWIHSEAVTLQNVCAEETRTLRDQLQRSKSSMVAGLSEAYCQIEQVIQTAMAKMKEKPAQPGSDLPAEEKLLVAEYALDFAAQAADRALWVAMNAMDAYLAQQQAEETEP